MRDRMTLDGLLTLVLLIVSPLLSPRSAVAQIPPGPNGAQVSPVNDFDFNAAERHLKALALRGADGPHHQGNGRWG
jgi:hypothetical protein